MASDSCLWERGRGRENYLLPLLGSQRPWEAQRERQRKNPLLPRASGKVAEISGLLGGDRRSDIWVMQTQKAGSWGSPNSGSSLAELTLGPLGPPASVWRPGIVRSCNALGAEAGSCWLCDSKRSACRASLTPATHTAPHTPPALPPTAPMHAQRRPLAHQTPAALWKRRVYGAPRG